MLNLFGAFIISVPTLTGMGTASAVCAQLDRKPTVTTVEHILLDLVDQGYSDSDIASFVVKAVAGNCPSHLPLLQQFVEKWS